jgi:hypothetical protein
MARVFCIPGIVFLFCAFVLSLLVSISLPFLTALDIARVHASSNLSTSQNVPGINQIRVSLVDTWTVLFTHHLAYIVSSVFGAWRE